MDTPLKCFQQRGFTVVELVMTVVILSVVAAYAAPRLLNLSDFYARGFHDETLGYLRYAQKTAIAHRRTVCMVFSSNSLTLSLAATPTTTTCTQPLNGPTGSNVLTARTGVNYSPIPTAFGFNALGQPINGSGTLMATQTIQIATTTNITIESNTGYVHD